MNADSDVKLIADDLRKRTVGVIGLLVFCTVIILFGILFDFTETRRVFISPEITKLLIIIVGVLGEMVGVGSIIGLIRIRKNGRVLLSTRGNFIYAANLLRSTTKPFADLKSYEIKQYAEKGQKYLLLVFGSGSFNIPLDLTKASIGEVKTVAENLKESYVVKQ